MSDSPGQTEAKPHSKKSANSSKLFTELIACVIIPVLILKYLSGDDRLGPTYALIAALSLPITVGLWGFVSEKKVGFVPALGFISILLTGGIGILKLPKEYIAYKEALIPGVIAVATIISAYTKKPLIRLFLYNDTIMDTEKIDQRLRETNKVDQFNQMMRNATWMLAASFVLSAVLNFVLAKWIVVSESGTDAFNSELGSMALYSYPIIVVPCMVITIFALFYVFRHIKKLTGFEVEDFVQQ